MRVSTSSRVSVKRSVLPFIYSRTTVPRVLARSVYTDEPSQKQQSQACIGKKGFKRIQPPLPVTVGSIRRQAKKAETFLCMLTAYDAPSAALAASANVDMILVGDSLGMVVQGRSSTVRVSMDDIVSASQAVDRGLKRQLAEEQATRRPLVIGDMTFGSYLTPDDAVHNAARLIRDGRADAVKLEGGKRVVPQIESIVAAGIGVMGHIGLTPQTCGKRYAAVGKTAAAALRLIEDAEALQAAGCFAIVLECVPEEAARAVTERLRIPCIGIGAGRHTSGQVLVMHDVLGMYQKPPRFAAQFADIRSVSSRALTAFRNAVASGQFPGEEYTPTRMTADALLEFRRALDDQVAAETSPGDTIASGYRPIHAPMLKRTRPEPTATFRNVAVVGGGAVGLGLAARLALAGPQPHVQVITRRQELIRSIHEQGGICVDDYAGSSTSKEQRIARVECSANLNLDHRLDLVILAHKASSSDECARAGSIALEALQKYPNCSIITIQNGALQESTFENDTNGELRERLLLGITTFGATAGLLAGGIGRVKIAATGHTIVAVRNRENEQARIQASNTVEFFDECKVVSTFSDDWQVPFWNKLCVSAVILSITALARVKNGILAHPCSDLSPSIATLCKEIAQVARTVNIRNDSSSLEDKDVGMTPVWKTSEDLMAAVNQVCLVTAENSSSMLTDVIYGRPTESCAILGYIQDQAKELALETPALTVLASLLSSWDKKGSDPRIHGGGRSLEVLAETEAMRNWVRGCRLFSPHATIGFVPTMGALHEGHLDLVRRAKSECDVVCVSIFVNPTQFAAHEDLGTYPRSMDADISKLASEGVDVVFTPDSEKFYGPNFVSYIVPSGMAGDNIPAAMMPEGAARPQFFRGVATVVAKLFNVVEPDKSYFGQKDAQQCVVVRRLAEDLNFKTKIVVCRTRREPDGLAMSSRNAYLDSHQRELARAIFMALKRGAAISNARSTAGEIRAATINSLRTSNVEIEYVSLADSNSAIEIPDDAIVDAGKAVLSVAVSVPPTVGNATSRRVRLIDNVLI